FFFSSRRRHTRFSRDWSSDVCSSDLMAAVRRAAATARESAFARSAAASAFAASATFFSCFTCSVRRSTRALYSETVLRWQRSTRSEERRGGKECRRWWAADGDELRGA